MNEKKVFITAEGEINHNGDIEIAKKMIKTAKEIGADAIKFLIYKTDDFVDKDSPYYDIFNNNELVYEEWQELKIFSDKVGIMMYCTPAHNSAVDIIEKLDLPYIKIGSTNITNFPLLKKIAETGIDILLSTGASTIAEVDNAVNYIIKNNGKIKMLYHCTANYPAEPENIDLNVIKTLKQNYSDMVIGYSDHTLGISASVGAVVLGAKAIEKHFTLDNNMEGPDHSFSTNKEDFKKLIDNIRDTEKMLQSGKKTFQASEKNIRLKGRRYLAVTKNLSTGTVLNENNIKPLRVNIEKAENIISPEFYETVLNKKINYDIKKGQPLKWDMLNEVEL